MRKFILIFFILFLGSGSLEGFAQRSYSAQSVLASGTLFLFAADSAGIFQINLDVLRQAGFNESSFPSNRIKIFSKPPGVLPEAVLGNYSDDLVEIPIFPTNNAVYFYAAGAHFWQWNTTPSGIGQPEFVYQHHPYSNRIYFYVKIEAGASLISNEPFPSGNPGSVVESGPFYMALKPDFFNFLGSGKRWFGHEFANAPGKKTARNIRFLLPAIRPGSTLEWQLEAAGRSLGSASRFSVSILGGPAATLDLLPTSAGPFDQFATSGGLRFVSSAPLSTIPGNSIPPISCNIGFQPGSFNAQGWLGYLGLKAELFYRYPAVHQVEWEAGESLYAPGSASEALFSTAAHRESARVWSKQLWIRRPPSAAAGWVEYRVQMTDGNTTLPLVWDVSQPMKPVNCAAQLLPGGVLRFGKVTSTPKTFLVARTEDAPVALPMGRVSNQNLHGTIAPTMVIIAADYLVEAARRLADYRSAKSGLSVAVVPLTQVYNEFSGGIPDPTAIRDFLKMYWDRSNGDTTRAPRYLLLMGAAHYDYKGVLPLASSSFSDPQTKGNGVNNTLQDRERNRYLPPGLLPWESDESLQPLSTHTTDDYYGFLENGSDISDPNRINTLRIAIGRIPAYSLQEANAFVQKIIDYESSASLGDWRTRATVLADDEDQNLHLEDAEELTNSILAGGNWWQINKIYLDAFPQQNTPAGNRYPEATQASTQAIEQGTLVWNYTGHGSSTRLAEEVLLDENAVQGWNNRNKYPLFITATCDFVPFDNPFLPSLGRQILMKPQAGAMAFMTTTRVVFASSNRIMNTNYLRSAFQFVPGKGFASLGEAAKNAKNLTYQTSSDIINNRKFVLLGDPSQKLAFPEHRVILEKVNGRDLSAQGDTIRPLDTLSLTGRIEQISQQPLRNFNGKVQVVLYDQPVRIRTLANDPGSLSVPVEQNRSILFKGTATVQNGSFSLAFIVPKDVQNGTGPVQLHFYAENGSTDAMGVSRQLILTGGNRDGLDDQEGPFVKAWLNDEKFVNGSLTNNQPILLVKLADSSGINTNGESVGRGITAILNNDQQNPIPLTGFYQADPDTYKKGRIRYQMPALEAGEYTLEIKAWDAVNQSGSYTLRFRVGNPEELLVERVLNYPNPFTTQTSFWFEHNRPFESLQVHIQVFSLSGKLVKSLRNTIMSTGNRSNEVTWDGRDDFGSRLARGVYWYRLRVQSSDGKQKEVIQKLVIL